MVFEWTNEDDWCWSVGKFDLQRSHKFVDGASAPTACEDDGIVFVSMQSFTYDVPAEQ